MVAFNQALSPDSIYLRYFHPISAAELTSHEQLARMCFIDYDRETALVAERQMDNGERAIVALGQLARLHGTNDAEFAILVTDLYQNMGLGTELLTRLLEIGREEKLERVMAEILPENEGMKRVSQKLGFKLKLDRETRVIHAEITL